MAIGGAPIGGAPIGAEPPRPALVEGEQPAVRPVDWPNPQRPQERRAGFIGSVSLALVAKPFAQVDWPVPKGRDRLPVAFVSLNLHQTALARPFNFTGWANPVRQRHLTPGIDVGVGQLLNVLARPFTPPVWANPVRRVDARPDWWSLNLLQSTLAPVQLPPHYEYGNPQGVARLNLGFSVNLLHSTLAEAPQPFTPIDWPNPRGPQRPVAFHIDPLKLPLFGQDEGLPRDYDWPNPPLGHPSRSLGFLSTAISASTERPFRQATWDVFSVTYVPLPQQAPNLLLSTLAAVERPFAQTDWPNPARQSPTFGFTAADLLQTTLSAPQPLPFNQTDWPVPKGPVGSIVLRSRFAEMLPLEPHQPGDTRFPLYIRKSVTGRPASFWKGRD